MTQKTQAMTPMTQAMTRITRPWILWPGHDPRDSGHAHKDSSGPDPKDRVLIPKMGLDPKDSSGHDPKDRALIPKI